MTSLNKQQIEQAVKYINQNARELHGFDEKVQVDLEMAVGPDVKVENVLGARLEDGQVVLVVDRGIKGSPKYRLDPAALETETQRKQEEPEVKTPVRPTITKTKK